MDFNRVMSKIYNPGLCIGELVCGIFFFFSSRRRHTRSLCDWSSDVCSSDLEPVLLNDLVARFDVEMKRPLKGYSKGMRQKIGIVLAFMCDPQVLILDEPTSGLDPLLQKVFNEFLLEEQARGKTIFMSSHIMSEVEKVCHRIAVIRKGELVTVEEVETLRENAGKRGTVEFRDRVTEEE